MPITFSRSSAAALAGALLFASSAAMAQQATPPATTAQGPFKLDLVAVQPEWTKVCDTDPNSKKEVCYTTRDFGAQADQPILALAVYESKSDGKADQDRILRLLLPPGLMLKPGFRFAVDKASLESGAFEICFPNGCFAEAKIKSAAVDSMKKGEKVTIIVKNQVNAEVTFSVPLAGFGKAYDGPAVDRKVLEEQQKKLQEELQKKAEEERKKLEAQKSGGAATPAPVAPAPAKK